MSRPPLWLVLLLLSLPGVTRAEDGAVPAAAMAPAGAERTAAGGPAVPEPEIPVSQPPELAQQEQDLGWSLLKTLVGLGVVVALAWLTLNVGLRKLLGIRGVVGTQLVSVLERVPLDQKRSLFVVEVAGEVLLLGGSDGGLTLLSKLDRAEVERLRGAGAGAGGVQLSPTLQKLLGRKDAPPPAAP